MSNTPIVIQNIDPNDITELDVRPILKSGGEPFQQIMDAVGRTTEKGALKLRATFEPKPLFRVLGNLGWSHWVESGKGEDWIVWFYKDASPAPTDEILAPLISRFPDLSQRLKTTDREWTLDVRELSPPEPMELTLALLDRIPPEVRLIQINLRVPQFLLPLLDERGMRSTVLQNEENNVRIEITRT